MSFVRYTLYKNARTEIELHSVNPEVFGGGGGGGVARHFLVTIVLINLQFSFINHTAVLTVCSCIIGG